MKRWYFYDESGIVTVIFKCEPPREMLEQGSYIIAGEPADKDGYDTVLKVDLSTHELKVEYVKCDSGQSGGSIDTTELNKKIDNVDIYGDKLRFFASGKEVKEVTLPTSTGGQGKDGVGLDFTWRDAWLGVKKTTDKDYKFENLKGKDGKDGVDGKTPIVEIGTNGNWFINGVDTGKPSRGENGKDSTSSSSAGTATEKVNLSSVVLDQAGIDALNTKISYGHNHKINQVVGSAKKWADNKYVLDDIIEYLHTDLDNYKNTTNTEIKNLKSSGGKAPIITIGDNGNWFIDGKDTGKPSRGENGISSTGGATGKVKLKDIDLDNDGLKVLNEKIAYQHNHQGTQVVCNTKAWANNSYILEDIIDFLGKKVKDLEVRIKTLEGK